MPTPRRNAAKIQSLRQQGVLNPHPEAVTDPLFQTGEFFDPQDLLQVKYEMLRRVEVDKAPSPKLQRPSDCRVRRSIRPSMQLRSRASRA